MTAGIIIDDGEDRTRPDYSDTSVDELVDLIDSQPLTAEQLEEANTNLEEALMEITVRDAINDLASYVELVDGARGRALGASIDRLDSFVRGIDSALNGS